MSSKQPPESPGDHKDAEQWELDVAGGSVCDAGYEQCPQYRAEITRLLTINAEMVRLNALEREEARRWKEHAAQLARKLIALGHDGETDQEAKK